MKNKTRCDLPLLILLLLVGIASIGVGVSKISGYSISTGISNSVTSDVGYADDVKLLASIERPVYVVTKSGISQADAERLAEELEIPTFANPADLSGNDIVDIDDLCIFANYWLENDCELVSDCQGSDFNEDGSVNLVDYIVLGYYWQQGRINRVVFDNGMASFIDSDKFQAVPMYQIDPGSVDPNFRYNEDGEATLFEGFDFDAINEIIPLSGSSALDKFQTAIADANLTPQLLLDPDPIISYSRFQAVDLDDVSIVDVNIDTHVEYNFSLDGIPLLGPGAKVGAAFSPNGETTQLLYSLRELEMGTNVSIITPGEAMMRFAEALGDLQDLQLDEPQLVYYAPPFSTNNVAVIIPHYQCNGTATIDANEVTLLTKIIPATDDLNFVPTVELNVEVHDSNTIVAEALVSGGNGPYQYKWFSSLDVTNYNFPSDANRVQYTVTVDYEKETSQETVSIIVLDGNGICTQGTATVVVTPVLGHPTNPGGYNFGTERAVRGSVASGNQTDFINRMTGGGVYPLFNWGDESAWERDFKDPVCHLNGLDTFYVDNVDMTFYIGHASPTEFTFLSQQDDESLHYSDAAVQINSGGWGNQNLEWLALMACQVLNSSASSTPSQRWGPAFNGLHLLLGFGTDSDNNPGFGAAFAEAMMGKRVLSLLYVSDEDRPELGWAPPPVTIRAAWFHAKKLTQMPIKKAVVMGPMTSTGAYNSYDDYFHGKGPVAPDLSSSAIAGFWWLTSE